jgi:drug/metabolite transporter (DMT)-like permease
MQNHAVGWMIVSVRVLGKDLSMPTEFTPPLQKPADNVTEGVIWMLLSGLLFLAMTGTVRHLGSSLPAAEAGFIRYAIGLALVSPALYGALRRRMPGKTWALYGVRGLVHGGSVLLWFYAMARIPVAEVTALGYTSPIFVTIGAALFLGERIRARRVMAVVFGLIGVLIILRPGFQEIGDGQMAQVLATPLFAISFLIAKRLTDTARPVEIVAMLSLACTVVLAPMAWAVWRTPTLTELAWLTVTAICATLGHWCLTRAYRAAPISVTQPVSFLQIVWATALGYFVFGEAVDIWVVAGAGVIITAATYIARREMMAARAEKS